MKKLWLIIWLCPFLVKGQCFWAQGYDPAATEIKVCIGETIRMIEDISSPSCIGRENIAYEYEPNGARTSSKTHTYNRPGLYTITQYFNNTASGNPGGATSSRNSYVRVVDRPTPKVSIQRCAGRTITIDILEKIYDIYEVNYGDGLPTTTSLTHVYSSPGSYNIKVSGRYSGGSCVEDTILSNIRIFQNVNDLLQGTPLVSFPKISICEGEISLEFLKIDADLRYEIALSTQGETGPFTSLKTWTDTAGSQVIYAIQNVNTLTGNNALRLKITDKCTNAGEKTTTLVAPVNDLLPLEVTGVTASFDLQNQLILNWKKLPIRYEPFDDLSLYAIVSEGKTIGIVDRASQYRIQKPAIKPTCYTIEYTTSCGIKTLFSNPVCPVILSLAKNTFFERQLEWSPYQNSENIPVSEYRVFKLDAHFQTLEEISAGTATTYSDIQEDTLNQLFYYRVQAKLAGRTDTIFSNLVRVERPSRLVFPNIFTPASSLGINDTFKPKGVFIASYLMEVYDKNGLRVFSTENIHQGWDGTFKGQALGAGTYVYAVKAIDFSGKPLERTGTFMLVR